MQNVFQTKGQRGNISLDDENLSEDIHADDTVMLPEDYADSKELKRCLKKVIEGLKPEQRSAVILYYYDGMPLKKGVRDFGDKRECRQAEAF